MAPRRRLSILLAAIALASTTAAVLQHIRSAVDDASAVSEAVASRYHLTWTFDTELLAGGDGAPLAGHVDLEGTLQLVEIGERDGHRLVAASLLGVTKHDVVVLGRRALADEAAVAELVGPTAWAQLGDDGRVETIYFAPGAPRAFTHLMQQIIGISHVAPQEAPTWTTIEPGPSGVAEVAYTRDGAQLRRERVRYTTLTSVPAATQIDAPTLTSSATIVLDERGRVVSLVDDEQVAITDAGTGARLYRGKSHFAITAERGGRTSIVTPPPSLAGYEARSPGEMAIAGDVDRQLVEGHTGGLTFDGLTKGLTTDWGSRRTEKRQWIVKATSLLKLDPSLAPELVEMAFGEGTTLSDAQRLTVFEMLAAAGHKEAQAAMRDALGRPAARPQQVALVQRFSFVERPDAETVAYVLAAREGAGADRNYTIATSFTLGSIAKHLRASGDEAAAGEIDAVLQSALAAARTDSDRAELLRALGNAASVVTVPAIQAYATSTDAAVRTSAAWALRDTPTAEARATLFTLAGDSNADVTRSALAALDRHPLAAGDFDQLERVTTAAEKPLPDTTSAALVTLLSHHLDDAAPGVRRMLEAIRSNTNANSELRERARVVLAQLP